MKKLTILLASLLICVTSFAQRNNAGWLKSAVFYQIYPSSYQDSDGDGFGDIKGVQSRLDYIKSIGVNAIWFNPVFKSAFQDGGYDVIDFYQVDPRFGTNTDLIEFVKAAHKSGMHVVMDLVAGHSSDKSAWFSNQRKRIPISNTAIITSGRQINLPTLHRQKHHAGWKQTHHVESTISKTIMTSSLHSTSDTLILIPTIPGSSRLTHLVLRLYVRS